MTYDKSSSSGKLLVSTYGKNIFEQYQHSKKPWQVFLAVVGKAAHECPYSPKITLACFTEFNVLKLV